MRFRRIFCILLFFSYLYGHTQQYNFTRLSLEDGLAQSQVWAMIQDQRGNIWMGTRGGGVSMYNGLGFTTYNVANGIPNHYIWTIAEDDHGNIWIGTDEGMVRYNGLFFERVNPSAFDLKQKIQHLSFDEKGGLWIAAASALIYYDGKNFSEVKDEKGASLKNVFVVAHNMKGRHWVGSNDGLFEFSGVKLIKRYGTKEGLSNLQVRAICFDAVGNPWVGTYGSGIFIYNGVRFYRPEDEFALRNKIIHHLMMDSKKNIWISTLSSGVFKFSTSDSSITWLSEKDGLSNDHVKVTIEDRWGNYWMGTSGGGVSRYGGQKFSHYNRMNGLPGDFIHSVYTDREGRIWAGVSDKGVSVLDSGKFKNFSGTNIFKDVKVKSIAEGPGGWIWLGTDGQGVFIRDSTGFYPIRELNGKFIRDLQMDDQGRMWVATAGAGIYILRMDSSNMDIQDVTNLTVRKGLSSNRIHTLHLDRKMRIWFGTDGDGAGYIVNDTMIVNLNKNLLSDPDIRSITEDQYGNIWLGTNEKGVNIIPDGKETNPVNILDADDGLSSSNIYLILPDAEGNMFVGSEKGIDHLVVSPNGMISSIRHMGRSEGFIGIETCQNAAVLDLEGNAWFGTVNGLTKYDPRTNIRNEKAPLLQMTGIQIFYKPIMETRFSTMVGSWFSPGPTLELEPEENHIGFEFVAVNLPNPEAVMYTWKLEGLEKKWSPLSHNRNVTYSNLAPGDYTFKLRAINEDGIETPELQSISFTILPPFWKTWWFISIIVGLGIGIISLIIYLRVASVKRKSELVRKELEAEKNTLELEQKALRLQMNPHFIFNALNSIQALISQKDEKTARLYLSKFSRLMRMILDNSRQGSISLQTEISTLENYLAIEKFCSDDAFDFTIHCDENIPKDEIQIPPMLLQPFVENAVIHGIRHLNRRGNIDISFTLVKDILECKICDNGVGRTKAIEIRSQQDEHHKSTALIVTQERLDILNKDSGVKSLEILDLEENGQPSGTCIIIRLKQ